MNTILNDASTWGAEANKINNNFSEVVNSIVNYSGLSAAKKAALVGIRSLKVEVDPSIINNNIRLSFVRNISGDRRIGVKDYTAALGLTILQTLGTGIKGDVYYFNSNLIKITIEWDWSVYADGYSWFDDTSSGAIELIKHVKVLKTSVLESGIWFGKKILWLGTSIPEGGLYPAVSSVNVGATLTNNAKGASFVKLGITNPTVYDQYKIRSLVESIAEKEAIWSAILTAPQMEAARTYSYERLITPFIAASDLIVFDHGFNDKSVDMDTVDANSRDRSTFIGAMNWLIDYIFSIKPTIRIFIVGHYEDKALYFYSPNICAAQLRIADNWGFPIAKNWEKTGWSQQWVAGTSALYPDFNYNPEPVTGNRTVLQTLIPDSIHLHTDLTGKSSALLGRIITTFLQNNA